LAGAAGFVAVAPLQHKLKDSFGTRLPSGPLFNNTWRNPVKDLKILCQNVSNVTSQPFHNAAGT
jgi:hypothetical protein